MHLSKILLIGLSLSVFSTASHAYNDERSGGGAPGATPGVGGSPSGVGKVVDRAVHGENGNDSGERSKGTSDEVNDLRKEKQDTKEE